MIDWPYIDKDLPALVLGTKQCALKFKPEYDFKPIRHQTGGHACHLHSFFGKILTPNSNGEKLIDFLKNQYYHSCFIKHVPLDDIIDYRQHIKNYNVDCSLSYYDFQEALYPIDYEYVYSLTTDSLPEDLDDMVNWKENAFGKICGIIGRWQLFVLTENSD